MSGPRRPARTRPVLPGAGAVLAALVLGALAAVTVFPDRLGIDHRTPFVQIIAFRPQLAAGLVIVALLVGLTSRSARAALPVAVALGLVGLFGLAVVAPRAMAGPAAAPPAGGGSGAWATGGTLSVLTLNTFLGRADPDVLARLIRDRRPDLVALPEAGDELRRRLVRELDAGEGPTVYRSYTSEDTDGGSPMTVLVTRDLGRPTVTTDRGSEFPSLVVDLRRGLRFVATHPQAPKPGDTFAWRRDIAGLARWCTADRPTVVAGDLNATADHAALRAATEGCRDAADEVGEGLTGTWPAGLPRLAGAQIDHVLLTGGPRAESVEIIDVRGTDHRAVLAVLRLPAPSG